MIRKWSLLDLLTTKPGVLSTNDLSIRAQSNFTGVEISFIDEEGARIPSKYTKSIQKLYLSSNLLSNLHSVERFINILELSVAYNKLRYYEDISCLKYCPKLVKVDLRGNQVTSLPYVYDYLLYLCPQLKYIDDQLIRSYSKERDAIFLQARLKYQKLKNYLSTGIYNELRNFMVSSITIKRELNHEILQTVYGHHR